ncbi:MAG: phosphoglucosamine mutase [Candidatus Kapaibacteriota bacterium]
MACIRSISGLRATLGTDLTPALVARYASAFGTVAPPGPIVVGRDGRPSGLWIEQVVIGALQACGRTVRVAGMVPTPTVQLLTEHSDAAGGIVITASHNPEAWNGLKFLGSDGVFLNAEMNAMLWDHVDQDRYDLRSDQQHGNLVQLESAVHDHLERVLKLPAVATAPLASGERVVVDAVNASGSVIIPQLLQQMGYDVIALACDGSGRFPHTPEPLPENLTELARAVVDHGASYGVAVDPDADRLVLIDGSGTPIGEECTVALAAAAVYHAGGQGPAVVNYSTSRMIDAVAHGYDQTIYRSAVGEINVVERMRATGAVIGGEGSGGVIYPACHMGRDSVVALACISSYLRSRNITLRQAVDSLPRLTMIKHKIAVDAGLPLSSILDDVQMQLPPDAIIHRTDGLYASWTDRWVHVRGSNTEPIMRIIVEADRSDTAHDLLNLVQKLLTRHE